MRLTEFGQNYAKPLRQVHETGKALDLTKSQRDDDYVTIVPTATWREAEQALAAMRGLRVLAEHADCDDLRDFALFALGKRTAAAADQASA